MGQEVAAQQGMVLGLDGAPLPAALDPLGPPAAGAVQGEPMPARLKPALRWRGHCAASG